MIKRAMSIALGIALCATGCDKDKDKDNSGTAYQVNEANSVAEWTGSAPHTANEGTIGISKTNIMVKDGKIISGNFIMPVSSLKNTNLPPDLATGLLTHLKTADFFNMALYPNAAFEFKKMEAFSGGEPSIPGANFKITGNFSLIGATREISFPAHVQFAGDSLHVESTFKFDRTKWGMTYHAHSSYGDDQIFPEVEIHLKLHAGK